MEFRYAERKDCALILQFIKELADYEKMLDEVVADVQEFIWKICMYGRSTGEMAMGRLF